MNIKETTKELFGHEMFPRCLQKIVDNKGFVYHSVSGNDAWKVVEKCDPTLTKYLRELDKNSKHWEDMRRDVACMRGFALTEMRRLSELLSCSHEDTKYMASVAFSPLAYAECVDMWTTRLSSAAIEESLMSIDLLEPIDEL